MATILPSILAVDRETLLFVKKETTFGVGVKPGAADQVLVAGDGAVTQALGFIADAQKRNTLSMLSRIAGRFEPGQATFPIYLKPSGTAGTAPEGDALYESLFGRKTVTGGVSVLYSLLRVTDTRPSLTLWMKQGHFVHMCWGGLATQGRFPLKAGNSDDAIAQLALTVLCAQRAWTGTDELAATASAAAGASAENSSSAN